MKKIVMKKIIVFLMLFVLGNSVVNAMDDDTQVLRMNALLLETNTYFDTITILEPFCKTEYCIIEVFEEICKKKDSCKKTVRIKVYCEKKLKNLNEKCIEVYKNEFEETRSSVYSKSIFFLENKMRRLAEIEKTFRPHMNEVCDIDFLDDRKIRNNPKFLYPLGIIIRSLLLNRSCMKRLLLVCKNNNEYLTKLIDQSSNIISKLEKLAIVLKPLNFLKIYLN